MSINELDKAPESFPLSFISASLAEPYPPCPECGEQGLHVCYPWVIAKLIESPKFREELWKLMAEKMSR